MSSRFKREHWLDLGARLLSEDGPAALTIERLTTAAQRTRGSFYHHFGDRDAFLRALLERWRATEVDDLRKGFAPDREAQSQRRLTCESALDADFRLEREIRRLAASERIVRDILDEVDRARIESVACVIAHLRPDVKDPLSLAFVLHCALVGGQWLLHGPEDPRIPAILEIVHRLVGLEEEQRALAEG
jgi:AcrR family transcriptional regulator